MADPGSEERGGARFGGLAPEIFLVNFRQFRELLKVFGENKGRGARAPCDPQGSATEKNLWSLGQHKTL